jgi:hypothetical protein
MMGTWLPETCRELKETYMKKEIMRQVGYLQRLHQDARSTEHKILTTYLCLEH